MFLERFFKHEEELPPEVTALESKKKDLADLVKRREQILTWMQAGAGTAQDRDLVSQLEEKISQLETELGEVHQESKEN